MSTMIDERSLYAAIATGFEDALLEMVAGGSKHILPTAALALGVLNAGSGQGQSDAGQSKILRTLSGLIGPEQKDKHPLSATLAAIGLGFVDAGSLEKGTLPDYGRPL